MRLQRTIAERVMRAVVFAISVAAGAVLAIAAACGVAGLLSEDVAEVRGECTVDNLRRGCHMKRARAHYYNMCAGGAEREGRTEAARLFRALSASEGILCRDMQRCVGELGHGFTPMHTEEPACGTLSENIAAAVEGEERFCGLCGEWMATALEEDAAAAARLLLRAAACSLEHRRQLEALRMNRGGAGISWSVCPECGWMEGGESGERGESGAERCPLCRTERGRFLTF